MEIGNFDQLLIFCDIHGGSVAQEIFMQTHEDSRNIQIIAGYNLALVMDMILKNHVVTPEEIRESIENSKNAIVYLNDVKPVSEEETLF
jgi:mannose/fructose-specific phosphotransferase system component IIA